MRPPPPSRVRRAAGAKLACGATRHMRLRRDGGTASEIAPDGEPEIGRLEHRQRKSARVTQRDAGSGNECSWHFCRRARQGATSICFA
jgi:hypothetical protein